jgi:hypothetical protein
MTPDDEPAPRPPQAESAKAADQVYGSVDARRNRRGEALLSAREVLHRWGYVVKSSSARPEIVAVDPASPGECLCGEPAEFVVKTNWFSGRQSLDPVCERHVDEVVRGIRKAQARRNGA